MILKQVPENQTRKLQEKLARMTENNFDRKDTGVYDWLRLNFPNLHCAMDF